MGVPGVTVVLLLGRTVTVPNPSVRTIPLWGLAHTKVTKQCSSTVLAPGTLPNGPTVGCQTGPRATAFAIEPLPGHINNGCPQQSMRAQQLLAC